MDIDPERRRRMLEQVRTTMRRWPSAEAGRSAPKRFVRTRRPGGRAVAPTRRG